MEITQSETKKIKNKTYVAVVFKRARYSLHARKKYQAEIEWTIDYFKKTYYKSDGSAILFLVTDSVNIIPEIAKDLKKQNSNKANLFDFYNYQGSFKTVGDLISVFKNDLIRACNAGDKVVVLPIGKLISIARNKFYQNIDNKRGSNVPQKNRSQVEKVKNSPQLQKIKDIVKSIIEQENKNTAIQDKTESLNRYINKLKAINIELEKTLTEDERKEAIIEKSKAPIHIFGETFPKGEKINFEEIKTESLNFILDEIKKIPVGTENSKNTRLISRNKARLEEILTEFNETKKLYSALNNAIKDSQNILNPSENNNDSFSKKFKNIRDTLKNSMQGLETNDRNLKLITQPKNHEEIISCAKKEINKLDSNANTLRENGRKFIGDFFEKILSHYKSQKERRFFFFQGYDSECIKNIKSIVNHQGNMDAFINSANTVLKLLFAVQEQGELTAGCFAWNQPKNYNTQRALHTILEKSEFKLMKRFLKTNDSTLSSESLLSLGEDIEVKNLPSAAPGNNIAC